MNSAVTITGLELDVDVEAIKPENPPKPSQAPTATTIQHSNAPSNPSPDNYNFTSHHGRRYHTFDPSAYWLPNYNQEINRLDLQHNTWRLTFSGALYLPPLTGAETSVLDIGTGTGVWAIDFARENPSCSVIGTDLSPIQPTKDVPENVKFVLANVEEPWAEKLGDEKFDFVHSRTLLYGIHDWAAYFKQAWTHTKPGGWVQVAEPLSPVDFVPGHNTSEAGALYRWSKLCQEAAAKAGIDTQVGLGLPGMMRAQGFEQIEMRDVMWPVGDWAQGEGEKRIGALVKEKTGYFVEGLAKLLWTKELGWSEEAVDKELVEVRKDLEDGRNTYYWTLCVAWGRKPFGK